MSWLGEISNCCVMILDGASLSGGGEEGFEDGVEEGGCSMDSVAGATYSSTATVSGSPWWSIRVESHSESRTLSSSGGNPTNERQR